MVRKPLILKIRLNENFVPLPNRDWVQTFQLDAAASRQYRYQRWQATQSQPWLLSALVAAKGNDAYVTELATAAEAIGADSPGYDTLLYHGVRLLEEQDRAEQARKLLDANWKRIADLPPADQQAGIQSVAPAISELRMDEEDPVLVRVAVRDQRASSATPAATQSAASQRRRSTFSLR
jgi:hypothetical protein